MSKKNILSRRDFLKSTAIGVIGAAAAPGLLTSCGSASNTKQYPKADVPEYSSYS